MGIDKSSMMPALLQRSVQVTLLALCLYHANGYAQGNTNQKIAVIYAKAYQEQNKLDQAIATLKAELAKNPQSEELNNFLAELYLEKKQFDMSIAAYGEAEKYAPAEAKSFYDHKKATVLAIQAGKPVPALPEFRGPKEWSFNASLKMGYDDNVMQFSESSLATASQTNTASVGALPDFTARLKQQRSKGELNAMFNLNAQIYENKKVKSNESVNLTQTTGFNFKDPGFWGLNHSVSNTLSTSFVDGNNLKQQSIQNTLKWVGVQRVSEVQALNYGTDLRYQYYFDQSGEDNRSGFAVKPNLTLSDKTNYFSYTAGIAYEHLFAQGQNYQSDTLTVPLSLQKEIQGYMTSAGLTYSYINYPRSNNSRSDGNITLNAGVQKELAKNTMGSLDYGYTHNSSTLIDAKYNRHTIDAKVSHDF